FGSERRLLIDIDDFQRKVAFQVLFAQPFKILYRLERSGRLPGHEQAKNVVVDGCFFRAPGLPAGPLHFSPPFSRRFRPTTTRSRSDKSPMIFRIGTGSLRTKVGIAKIWSPCASCGFFTRSITCNL